jgi:DNA-directed RNA polymerase subunit RPC12/RpoP
MDQITEATIKSLPDIACKCDSKLFTPIGTTRDLSALQSPTGQRTLVYMQFGYLCVGCGAVITMQLDKEDKFIWIPSVGDIVYTGTKS